MFIITSSNGNNYERRAQIITEHNSLSATRATYHLCLSLAINNAVGSDQRTELNGISVGIESIATSIAPIACSTLFAFSINNDNPYPFEYHFVFYILAAMRLAAALLGWNRIADIENME